MEKIFDLCLLYFFRVDEELSELQIKLRDKRMQLWLLSGN
jgi:hypothetical protein